MKNYKVNKDKQDLLRVNQDKQDKLEDNKVNRVNKDKSLR